MIARSLLALLLAACAACRTLRDGQTAGEPPPASATRQQPPAAPRARFTGNEFLSDSVLEKVVEASLGDFAATGGRRSFVDDAAFEVEVRYRDAGFPFVGVKWSLAGEGAAAEPSFSVEEGPRVVIGAIEFSGPMAEGLDRSALEAFFEGPRTGLLGRGELVFVEDRVRAAAARIENEYVARGYLEVQVPAPAIAFDEDRRTATVAVVIDPGPRSWLARPIEIETPVLEPECRAALDEKLASLGAAGRSFEPRLPYELRGVLVEVFANHGYPDASLEFERSESQREDGGTDVHLRFRADPGLRVVLSAVRFEGNTTTRTSFLSSRMLLGRGDVLDAREQRDSLRKLYKTGLFRQVSARLEPDEGSERELVVELVEAPSFEVFAEPGFGSYELARLKVGTREKNLWGTGRQLRTQAKVALRALEAEVGLADPWFLRTALASDVSLRFEEREQPSFTSRSTGAAFTLSYKGSERTTETFGYQLRRSQITDVTADAVLDEEVQDLDLASLRAGHRYDSRNDYFTPTAGRFGEFVLEFGNAALGSELDFLRATGSLALYHALTESTTLAFALRSGWITPLGDDETIPLQERFFNGGENTVRSYSESRLGPLDDDGDPLGGETFAAATVELRQELGQSKLSTALFYDLGFVTSDHGDYYDPDEPNIGSAVGVGLRYRLPVGPVRLDLGWNPNRASGEDEAVLHFSLGMAF